MNTVTTTDAAPQLVLPGQTAAPAGPVDMTMMYLMHHGFRRDLNRFVKAVAATPTDDRRAWAALEARWGRFAAILHHHHTIEDLALWPFLVERAEDDELTTLEAMEAEHEQIDPLLDAVQEGFAALATGGEPGRLDDQRHALTVRLTAAVEAFARHLEHEETDAMVILQRRMTAADWAHLEKTIVRKQPMPLPLGWSMGWAADGLPPEQRNQVFSLLPVPFRVFWWLGHRGYARTEADIFRYAG